MTGEVIIQLPRYCLYTVIWLEKSSSSYPDTVSILSYDRRSHHPATQILSLYCHMTGEVIIQLPRYCLYTVMTGEVIIQLPDHVSMLSYDWRSHHPATRILSLYWHMTGEVIIQLPDHVSILSYDWRSHHPATQILSLYCHMTGKVIIHYPDTVSILSWQEKSSSSYPDTVSTLSYDWRSHHPATQILSLNCHMTGEVIIQLPSYCLYTDIWLEKSSSSYPDNISILSYDRRSHHPATQILSL
jgi:uncharacterized protein Usg